MTTFKFPASITENNGIKTVTAFNAEESSPVFVADSTHPQWDTIIAGLATGDPSVWDRFDVAATVMAKFNQVTERIAWDGENVLFDGEPIRSVLADQLERALKENQPENYTALAKFWEKLESNPSQNSREQAYKFLAAHKFQITPEGDVVAYKGVKDNGDGTFSSTHKSIVDGKPSAFVNGEPLPPLSVVTQKPGDVVHMPRGEVVENPRLTCHRGLHIGTYAYSRSFGNAQLEVHVNPRDIVSVPQDSASKVRVWRYEVIGVAGEPGTETVLNVTRDHAPVWAGSPGYKV